MSSTRYRSTSSHPAVSSSRWVAPPNTFGYNTPSPTSRGIPSGPTTRDLYPTRVATDLNSIPDEQLYAGQNSYGSTSTRLDSMQPSTYRDRGLLGGSYAGGQSRMTTSSAEPGVRRTIGGSLPSSTVSSHTLPSSIGARNGTLASGRPPQASSMPQYTHTYNTSSGAYGSSRAYCDTYTSGSSTRPPTLTGGYSGTTLPSSDRLSGAAADRNGGYGAPSSSTGAFTNSQPSNYNLSSNVSATNRSHNPVPPSTVPPPSSSQLWRESKMHGEREGISTRVVSPMGSPSHSNVSRWNYVPQGFRNLGNTCFMNAALQALLAMPSLISTLEREVTSRDLRSAYLAKDLIELADTKALSRGVILQSLKRKVGDRNNEFSSFGQNDGHEFLRTLLLCVHEEINRVVGKKPYQELKDDPREHDDDAARRWAEYHVRRDDSVINDFFAGQKKTVRTCDSCNTKSLNFDPFLDLSLPVPSSSSAKAIEVEQLISSFTGKERLSSTDSMFICPTCKKPRDAVQTTTIQVWPQSLVLHLSRFSSHKGRKVTTAVDFDKELKVEEAWGGSSSSRGLPTYVLTAVVVHTGSMDYGHYFAYVQVGTTWYLCDDSSIREVSSKDALREAAGAYMLFYIRK